MINWLDEAQRRLAKTRGQRPANTDETPVLAVMAVPHPGIPELPAILTEPERAELHRLARRWHALKWSDEMETQETINRLRRAAPASLVRELAEFRALVAEAER